MGEVQWFQQQQVLLCSCRALGFSAGCGSPAGMLHLSQDVPGIQKSDCAVHCTPHSVHLSVLELPSKASRGQMASEQLGTGTRDTDLNSLLVWVCLTGAIQSRACLCGYLLSPGQCSAPSRTQGLSSRDQSCSPGVQVEQAHSFPITVGMHKFPEIHSPITGNAQIPYNSQSHHCENAQIPVNHGSITVNAQIPCNSQPHNCGNAQIP